MKFKLQKQHTKKTAKEQRDIERLEKKQPKDAEWLKNHGRVE